MKKGMIAANHLLLTFDSPSDAVDAVDANPLVQDWRRHVDKRLRGQEELDYYGETASSWGQLADYAHYGIDADGVEAAEVDQHNLEMHDAPKSVFDPVEGMAGADVDVTKMLTGDPEHMIDYVLVDNPNGERVITLVVNIGTNCHVTADQMHRHGLSVLSAVLGLEDVGLQVEVIASFTTSGFVHRNYVTQRVHCKRAGEFLDPTKLMFPIVDPVFFRAIGLANLWYAPEAWWEDFEIDQEPAYVGGLGYTSGISSASVEEGEIVIERNDDALKKVLPHL